MLLFGRHHTYLRNARFGRHHKCPYWHHTYLRNARFGRKNGPMHRNLDRSEWFRWQDFHHKFQPIFVCRLGNVDGIVPHVHTRQNLGSPAQGLTFKGLEGMRDYQWFAMYRFYQRTTLYLPNLYRWRLGHTLDWVMKINRVALLEHEHIISYLHTVTDFLMFLATPQQNIISNHL